MATAAEQLVIMQQQMAQLQAQMLELQKQAQLELATKANESGVPATNDADASKHLGGNVARNNASDSAGQDQNEEHKLFIKQLSDLPENKANEAIRARAEADVGKYGAAAIAAVETSLKAEVSEYKTISPFDNVAGVFAQNSINTTATLSPDGYAGQRTQVQQQVPFPKDAGALWANVNLNQDNNLNVTGGGAGLNYVGVPARVGDVDVVAVGNATMNLNADGEFNGKNVSLLAGGIVKAHEPDSANYTAAVITNGSFDDLNLYGRVSKPVFNDGKTTVTTYGEGVYNVPDEKVSLGAGVRVDEKLGHGTGVYLQGSVDAANVNETAALSGSVRVGYTWGGAESKSEIEQRLAQFTTKSDASTPTPIMSNQNVKLTSEVSDASDTRASINSTVQAHQRDEQPTISEMSKTYYALEDNKKQQSEFLDHTAKVFAQNSGFEKDAAKQMVINLFEYEHDKQLQQSPSLG